MVYVIIVKRKTVLIVTTALIVSAILCSTNILLAQDLSPRATFDKLKEAYNKKDIEMYKEYITKGSVEMIGQMLKAGWRYEMTRDLVFVNESEDKEKTIIKCIEIDADENKKEVDYIFVIEDGVWKYDEVATMEKAMGSTESSSQQESLESNNIHMSKLSPKQTYMKYLNTNDITELKEIVTGKKLEQFGQFEMTSEQLSMLRKLSFQDQKIKEEIIKGNEATLIVEGTAFKGTPQEVIADGKIYLLKINNIWKVSDEKWVFPK